MLGCDALQRTDVEGRSVGGDQRFLVCPFELSYLSQIGILRRTEAPPQKRGERRADVVQIARAGGVLGLKLTRELTPVVGSDQPLDDRELERERLRKALAQIVALDSDPRFAADAVIEDPRR